MSSGSSSGCGRANKQIFLNSACCVRVCVWCVCVCVVCIITITLLLDSNVTISMYYNTYMISTCIDTTEALLQYQAESRRWLQLNNHHITTGSLSPSPRSPASDAACLRSLHQKYTAVKFKMS